MMLSGAVQLVARRVGGGFFSFNRDLKEHILNMRSKSTRLRPASTSLGALVGLVAMSAVAGVLTTVAVTPALALSGLAAGNAITAFDNLPEILEIDQLSQKSNIYAKDSDGSSVLLASFYDQNRVEVPSDQISRFVKDAAVAGEDPRFYQHSGIDIPGTIRAVLKNATSSSTQGGSTITQQYVKNVLVQKCEVIADASTRATCYSAATETTVDRKLSEMRLAIGIEKKYAKNDILRQYLNIIGFGGAVYGIEAAAHYYFNTTAADVSLPQAASLVAIVNNPVKFRLDKPNSETNGAAGQYDATQGRRDYILGEMLNHDKISSSQYEDAVATVITPIITPPSTGCLTAGANAFFCDYVVKQLQNDPAFGEDEDTRLVNFHRGGYDVYTTLDLELQNAAVTTMADNVPQSYPGWDVGSVINSVQVGTGRVLAMAQNKDYSQDPDLAARGASATAINYSTDNANGGSNGFQPGSTYKVFTLAEWLKTGHALREQVDSRRTRNWGAFQDSCRGAQTYPGWNPRNDSSSNNRSNYSALESTISSINTGFLGMAKELDLCEIRKTAEDFTVHRADGERLLQSAATVLGTNEIAPLTMAVAFAGIANDGTTCSPVAIDKVIGADGSEIPIARSECSPSVTPQVAAGMTYAMQRVMTGGTATQSNAGTSPRVPMIGKTGTTDGNKDTWMSGASSEVATVVGVVSVTGEINQRRVSFDSGAAATARHRMWPDVMSVANAKYGGEDFTQPTNSTIFGARVAVPDLAGMSLGKAESALELAGFTLADGGPTRSEESEGTISSSLPTRGSRIKPGSTVTVFTSEGPVNTDEKFTDESTSSPAPTAPPNSRPSDP